MKLIEGMKEIKRLEERLTDINQKISKYCADFDFENPTYPDQKGQITGWLQSVHDTLKAAADLRIRIQKTNLATEVPIEIGGEQVTHSIAEWIVRRRLHAKTEESAWAMLSNRNLPVGTFKTGSGDPKEVKVRLYYDPIERDKRVEMYRSEPGIIDRTLEVINATTEII